MVVPIFSQHHSSPMNVISSVECFVGDPFVSLSARLALVVLYIYYLESKEPFLKGFEHT